MQPDDVLRYIRARGGLSQTDLARLAGVAASTVSRIERNELDPTWSTMNRIFESTGYRPLSELSSGGDVEVVAAARRVLGELQNSELSEKAQSWVDRWRRARFIEADGTVRKVEKIGVQAGIASRIFDRPNAQVSVSYDRRWQDIVADLRANSVNYAVTGITATSLTRNNDGATWPVIYVDSIDRAMDAARLRKANRGEPRVTLLEFDDVSTMDTVNEDGIMWVSPGQALIDSYAGPGRMADQADVVASRWQSSLATQESQGLPWPA